MFRWLVGRNSGVLFMWQMDYDRSFSNAAINAVGPPGM